MNAQRLLQLWEDGNTRPSARGMLLHRAAVGAVQDVMACSAGQRAHTLLQWRTPLFGEAMACIADCPACGERVEFDLNGPDLYHAAYAEATATVEVETATHKVRARSPSLADLERHHGDPDALFASCVEDARKGKKKVAPGALPAEVRARIGEALLAADPLLDLRLDLTCPACAHTWAAPFDVVAYCWSEVDRWARRMLGSVHQLARAFGWSERDILDMSAWRREQYQQMTTA